MVGDNMEIEVDKKLIAPELNNGRFNTLVSLSISLMRGKLITVGTHYQILK
jgi:hypothetical protein